MKLHWSNTVAHFKCQLGRGVEADCTNYLGNDGGKLPGQHVLGSALVYVPELHEDFSPCLEVGPAVQCAEVTSLYFGNVVPRPYSAPIIVEDQRAALVVRKAAQQRPDCDLLANSGGLKFPIVCAQHVHYPHFESYRIIEI
jgi:hypothetical protein